MLGPLPLCSPAVRCRLSGLACTPIPPSLPRVPCVSGCKDWPASRRDIERRPAWAGKRTPVRPGPRRRSARGLLNNHERRRHCAPWLQMIFTPHPMHLNEICLPFFGTARWHGACTTSVSRPWPSPRLAARPSHAHRVCWRSAVWRFGPTACSWGRCWEGQRCRSCASRAASPSRSGLAASPRGCLPWPR